MGSEKSRYILNRSQYQDDIRRSGVRKDLQDRIDSLGEEELREKLLCLIAKDEYNLYLGVAAMLPLNAAIVDMILKAVCEQLTEDTGGYSTLDEERLCQLAYEFIDRSDELIKTGSVLLAAEVLLVTLVNLEPQMEFTEDEGWDLQVVIEECFKSLDFIGEGKYDPCTREGLKQLVDRYRKQVDPANSNYNEEWQLVVEKVGKLG